MMVVIDEIEKAVTEIQNILRQQGSATTHQLIGKSSCSSEIVFLAIEVLIRKGVIKRISSQYNLQTRQAYDVYIVNQPENNLNSSKPSSETTLNLVQCPLCGAKVRKDRIDRHWFRAHRRNSSVPGDVAKLVQCPLCEVKVRKGGFNRHMSRVHKPRDVQCPLCGAKVRNNNYDRHWSRAHQDLPKKPAVEIKKIKKTKLPRRVVYSGGRYYVMLKPAESGWGLGKPPPKAKRIVDGY